MDILLGDIFSTGSFLYLSGLVAASLLFAIIGIRELLINRYEGVLYMGLSLFFIGAHIVFLSAGIGDDSLPGYGTMPNAWEWMILLLGPALILLYLIRGLFSIIKSKFGEAALKTLLGLTLIGLLYLLGLNWYDYIKAILIMAYGVALFGIEIKTIEEIA